MKLQLIFVQQERDQVMGTHFIMKILIFNFKKQIRPTKSLSCYCQQITITHIRPTDNYHKSQMSITRSNNQHSVLGYFQLIAPHHEILHSVSISIYFYIQILANSLLHFTNFN